MFTTSWIVLFNWNFLNLTNAHLLYWFLAKGFLALAFILGVITAKNIQKLGRFWLLALILYLPTDAIWHMHYVQDQRIALVLSFCHFGVLCLVLPVHVALSSLIALIAYVILFSFHSFVVMLINHSEVFVLGTFCLAILIYVQYLYLKKAQQAKFFSSQQQIMQE